MFPLVPAQQSEAVMLMGRNQSPNEGTAFGGLGDRSQLPSTWAVSAGQWPRSTLASENKDIANVPGRKAAWCEPGS